MKKTSFFLGIIFSLVGIVSQAKDYQALEGYSNRRKQSVDILGIS